MKKEFATINDCKIAYALQGNSRLPVVVLSHALATRAEIWSYQLPVLSNRFCVLTYDIRGHGESEAGRDSYTFPLLASDVAKLIEHLNIGRVASCSMQHRKRDRRKGEINSGRKDRHSSHGRLGWPGSTHPETLVYEPIYR